MQSEQSSLGPVWVFKDLISFFMQAARLLGCTGWSEYSLGAHHFVHLAVPNSTVQYYYQYSFFKWACTRQNQQTVFAFNEDSDQTGWMPRTHGGCQGLMVSSCRQRRLIRLGGWPGWSESLLGALVILLVLSCWGLNSSCDLFTSSECIVWHRGLIIIEFLVLT